MTLLKEANLEKYGKPNIYLIGNQRKKDVPLFAELFNFQ